MIIETVILAAAAVFIVAVTQLVRFLRARALHATIQEAIRSGSPHAEELLAKLGRAEESRIDPHWGWILITVALATVAFGLVQGDPDDIKNMASIAVFPGLIGCVLVILSLRGGRR